MTSSIQLYDLEVFPNYFLAGFLGKDEDKPRYFEIYRTKDGIKNDVRELIEFIQDKWLVGYNSRYYDNQLIEWILRLNDSQLEDTRYLTEGLYDLSVRIIEKNYSKYRWDTSFKVIDLKRVGNIDKSLKMCGIDLKMPKVQDLVRPHDKYVQSDEIEEIQQYNLNDLEITKALYFELQDDIRMRKELSLQYDLDLMDYADSGLADRLLNKFYSEYTNQSYWDFSNGRTPRDKIKMSDIINEKVRFETEPMKKFLSRLKDVVVSPDDKFHERILIGSTYYDMLLGGLHSVRAPEIFQATDDMLLKDADVSSYYPINMINNGIKPEHLLMAFLDVLKDVTRTRLKAKAVDPKGSKAYGLKITINSVFGKMGYENSWMYDPKAMYEVTINGQLFLLMLIEALESNGFEVIYANTDGITAYVPKDREQRYESLCKSWQEYTRFDLEFENYEKAVIRDVNNYIIDAGDHLKMKGVFDTERWKDLRKGYEYPVVPLAVKKFFIDNVPVEQTIRLHNDILDFCIAQKAGQKFDIYFYYNDGGEIKRQKMQKTNRYYIGKGGGGLYKESGKRRIAMVSGQPVVILNDYDKNVPIKSYNIKHSYYVREAYKIINELKSKQQSLF